MEEEISVSVEEQLQCGLDALHDDVIRQHSGAQTPTTASETCVFFHVFR